MPSPPAAGFGAGFAIGAVAAAAAAGSLGASAPPDKSLNAPAATSMFDFDAPEDDPPEALARGNPHPRQNFAAAAAFAPQLPHFAADMQSLRSRQ